MLASRSSRFLVAVFVILQVAAAVWTYTHLKTYPASRWYYWTVSNSDQIDINSPTRRVIVDGEPIPESSFPAYTSMLKDYQDRCWWNRDYPAKTGAQGFTYRDVTLCNAAALEGDALTQAFDYWKAKVDDWYSRDYRDAVLAFGQSALYGLLGWVAVAVMLFLGKWIVRGK